jgi:hypothetical protein
MHFQRFLLYIGIKILHQRRAGGHTTIHTFTSGNNTQLCTDTKYTGRILGFSVSIRESLSVCVFGLGGTKTRTWVVFIVLFFSRRYLGIMSPMFETEVGLAFKFATILECGYRMTETALETRVFQELKSCVYWIEIVPDICSSVNSELED